MTKSIILVYKTDNHHSLSSRELIGVCDSTETTFKIVNQYAKEQGKELSTDQNFHLATYNQTQGYEGEGEFHIDVVDTNTLLG